MLNINSGDQKTISFQANYEYKSINRLVSDDMILENDPRTRYGQNISFKVDYILSKRWAVTALLPLVHQARTTFSESQNSFGIGDLTLLGQYTILKLASTELNVGLGLKLPTGSTSHKSAAGIFLSPDMQSGSGSLDYVFRLAGVTSSRKFPFLTTNYAVSYKKNSANDSFASTDNFGGRSFTFGDELLGQLGFAYQFISKNGFWIPDTVFKYRRGTANTEQTVSAPNSGGQWTSIEGGLSFVPNERYSIRANIELPIHQKIEGLQITTDLSFGVQFKYNFLPTNLDLP